MGVLSSCKKRAGTLPLISASTGLSSGGSSEASWLTPQGPDNGFVTSREGALRIVAFMRGVTMIAQHLSHLPIPFPAENKLGRDPQGRKLAAWRLMNVAFNEEMTAIEGRMMLWCSLICHGNAYAQIVRNELGEPIQLWPLQPEKMRVGRNALGELTYYYTTQNGEQVELNRRAVFHMRTMMTNGMVGISPITAAAQSLGLALNMERSANLLFKNQARPSGVLQTEGIFEDEGAQDRLRKQWQETNGGLENTGKPIILEAGMKYSSISITPVDAQLIQLRGFQLEEICRLLGLPPVKLGITTGATFASVELQNLSYVVDTLVPLSVIEQQCITRDLMSADEASKYSPRHNFKALLKGDTAARNAAYAVGRQWGWLSADDIRDLEDLPPLPDGIGNIYLIPVNMMDAAIVQAFWKARLESTSINNEAAKKKMEEPAPAAIPQDNQVVDAQVVPPKAIEPAADKEKKEVAGFDDLYDRTVLQPEIKAAYLQMMLHSAERTVRKETKAVEAILKSAAREGNIDVFSAKIDKFYSEHSTYMTEEMAPLADSMAKLFGKSGPEIGEILSKQVKESVSTLTKEARNRLLLQDFSKEDEAFVKLGSIVEEWKREKPLAIAQGLLVSFAQAIEDYSK